MAHMQRSHRSRMLWTLFQSKSTETRRLTVTRRLFATNTALNSAQPIQCSNIKAVTFDLDGTLWDTRGTLFLAQAKMLELVQKEAPSIYKQLKQPRSQSLGVELSAVRKAHPEIAHDIKEIRLLAVRNLASKAGYTDEVGHHVSQRAWEVFHHYRCSIIEDDIFEGADELLQALKHREYRLGSITNGTTEVRLIPWLHQSFDWNVTASIAGAAKPSPLPFQQAARLSGIPLNETMHVGDDWAHDVVGAVRAGVRHAVWLNPSRSPAPTLSPRYDIQDLTEEERRKHVLEITDVTHVADLLPHSPPPTSD